MSWRLYHNAFQPVAWAWWSLQKNETHGRAYCRGVRYALSGKRLCVHWRLNVILAVLDPSLPLHILLPYLECSFPCSVWGPPAVLQVSHSILTCLILIPSSVSRVVVTCLQLSPSAVGKGRDQVLLVFIFQMPVTELVSGGLWNVQSFIDPCLQFTFIEHPFIS